MAERRIDGPTPNGGVYAIQYSYANRIEIWEYDEKDEVIHRTYSMDWERRTASPSKIQDKT